jgi:hypothetical protein
MNKYYKILELPYDASLSEIKQAYRDLVRVWHPDRFARDERLQKRTTEKLIELNEAYRVLCSFTPEITPESESYTEPIDWTRYTKADKSSPPSFHAHSVRSKPSSTWHWYYGIVGIPLIGLGIIFWLSVKSSETTYTSTSPPPPVIQASTRNDIDLTNVESESVNESPLPHEIDSTTQAQRFNSTIIEQLHDTSNLFKDSLSTDSASLSHR